VYKYLSRFTKWNHYRRAVVAKIHGRIFPVPFNLNSLQLQFEDGKARRIEQKFVSMFGIGRKIPILELREMDDDEIKELAEYPSTGELFEHKMALEDLHDGPKRSAEVFGYHVCACEREFAEKGAQVF
jgi:UDP-galactopyranose mutase